MDLVTLAFPEHVRFTDDELFDICASNKELKIERNKQGKLIIMSPVGGLSSYYESELGGSLWAWNKQKNLGVVLSASAGFVLQDGSILSPDAAWIEKSRWSNLKIIEKQKFIPLCPDFVAEIRSQSDSIKTLQEKMTEWMRNGCRLGWLIDPIERLAYVYREATKPLQVNYNEALSGETVLPDFNFQLSSFE